MTYSVVSICNLALQMLDAPAIININDDSKRARACKRAYMAARDEVTVQYEWRVARARTTLAAETARPAFGWRYAYAWPSECLRLIRLVHQIEVERPVPSVGFQVLAGVCLTPKPRHG